MTNHVIYSAYLASPQNLKARTEAVNALRHLAMDVVTFNSKCDASYWSVYASVMAQIESAYPLLSWEVKRQMAKKSRRHVRRALEEHASVHI